LRNLCDHNKQREPASDEVAELIDGVEKITKTVFDLKANKSLENRRENAGAFLAPQLQR